MLRLLEVFNILFVELVHLTLLIFNKFFGAAPPHAMDQYQEHSYTFGYDEDQTEVV